MFEGLAILPVQYRSPAPPTPFQRLAQAMLEDLFTVKEFAEKYPRIRWWQRQRAADEEWLTSAGGVLIVEDELGPRESLRAILKLDYHVLMAVEGEQAIHLVEQEPVDIVLLDVRLPGLSGMQVLEKIKAIDSSLVAIVVTAYTSEETIREGDHLQVFAYITKPFSVPHLRETVRQAVAHRSP